MKDNVLAAIGIIAAAIALMPIVAGITVGSMHSRDSDERERIACVDSGGTHLRTSSGPVCIGVSE